MDNFLCVWHFDKSLIDYYIKYIKLHHEAGTLISIFI